MRCTSRMTWGNSLLQFSHFPPIALHSHRLFRGWAARHLESSIPDIFL